MNQWIERNRPLIVSLKPGAYKARDLVTKKIRQGCPVVFKWLMHFGSIVLLLSLVWLDCSIRGFDSFIRSFLFLNHVVWSVFSILHDWDDQIHSYVGCNCSGLVVHWICCWVHHRCYFQFGFAMALR